MLGGGGMDAHYIKSCLPDSGFSGGKDCDLLFFGSSTMPSLQITDI